MKTWTMLLLISLGSCSNLPVATRVTYVLGGMMSGPLRLTADLDAKVVQQADHPPGQNGDGARLDAWTMPVTSTHALTPESIRKISTLAGKVFENGIYSKTACGNGMISVDAFATFEIVAAGVIHRFSTPSPCMSTDSSDLQQSLYCAANPIGYGCTEIH